MVKSIRNAAAVLAVIGLVMAQPAMAAGATRSAQMLPMAVGSIGTIRYFEAIEKRWRCVDVDYEALGLDGDHVQVDTDGKVVLDGDGNPIGCNPLAGQAADGAGLGAGGGFPFEILLGLFGLGGVLAGLAGGGGSNGGGGSAPG